VTTAANRRTWRQVVVAAIVVIAVATIAIVGGATFFVYRHIRAEFVPADAAEMRMAAARARFGAQPALVRVDADGEAVVTGREDSGGSHAPLATLRALAYDSAARKLVDVSIPFWLLRLAPDGRISLDADSGIDFDAGRVQLNVAALEALGPGLVLDHADEQGLRVLVWTE
jgi:hypothetical protein